MKALVWLGADNTAELIKYYKREAKQGMTKRARTAKFQSLNVLVSIF